MAGVLTKCNKNRRVSLEIMNGTKSPVQLKQGDEVAEPDFFQGVQAEQAKYNTQAVITPSDLRIGHLCKEEQHHLYHVLKDSGVAGQKRLRQTKAMEHSIDTCSASPNKAKTISSSRNKEKDHRRKKYRRC